MFTNLSAVYEYDLNHIRRKQKYNNKNKIYDNILFPISSSSSSCAGADRKQGPPSPGK